MFKDELEGLIQDQLTKGNSPTGLLALRQIADLVMASYVGGAGPLTSPISMCVYARVCAHACVREKENLSSGTRLLFSVLSIHVHYAD